MRSSWPTSLFLTISAILILIPEHASSTNTGEDTLRWLPKGDGLLYKQRWLLHPPQKTWKKLTLPGEPVFSHDQRKLAVFDAKTMRLLWGPDHKHLRHTLKLKPWKTYHPLTEKTVKLTRYNVSLTWHTDDQLLVYRSAYPAMVDCRLLSLRTKRWRTAKQHCPEASMSYLGRAYTPVPGWLALESDAEGVHGIDFFPHNPKKTTPKDATFSHGSTNSTYYRLVLRDKQPHILRIQRCPKKHPPSSVACWQFHAWKISKQRPRVWKSQQQGLPFAPQPHPYKRYQMAWMTPSQICVGHPHKQTNRRCFRRPDIHAPQKR